MSKPPSPITAKAENAWLSDLVSEYSGPLEGFFIRRTGSRSDAEDLVQEVFTRLAKMDDTGRLDNPKAYIFQIAVNLLRDDARRASVRQADMHEPFDEGFHASATSTSPEAALLAREKLRCVEDALGRLPRKTQAVFLLHRLDGLKYREIAEAMGLSVSTIEKHMINALAEIARRTERDRS